MKFLPELWFHIGATPNNNPIYFHVSMYAYDNGKVETQGGIVVTDKDFVEVYNAINIEDAKTYYKDYITEEKKFNRLEYLVKRNAQFTADKLITVLDVFSEEYRKEHPCL